MAYGRGRKRSSAGRGRSSYAARRSTRRRAPVRRRVSRGRVRKSGAARGSVQTVRIVVQTTGQPAPGAQEATLANLGIQPKTVKPKTAKIGSN